MKTLHFLVSAWAIPLAVGAAETNAPKTFRCAGTVVDTAGRPPAGAVIESYEYGARGSLPVGQLELKHRVTAATNGAFELELTRATTVLLARLLLKEKASRTQWVGVIVCLASIVLVTI